MRASFVPIMNGDAGTRQVLSQMRRLARAGMISPMVRQVTVSLVRGTGRDAFTQAMLIRDWLDANVEFLRDPAIAEGLHTPTLMLKTLLTNGPPLSIDCDDAAILAAAMGGSIGLRSRFVVVGFFSPHSPFRHVWTELSSPHAGSGWWEMDVTRSQQNIPASAISRTLIVPV